MKRAFLRATLGALLTTAATLGSPIADADPAPAPAAGRTADAEAHLAHGLELRRELRDEDALAEFRAAYAIEKTPRARAQIGLAEDALGLWVEAEVSLREVLATNADPWVDKRRAELARELSVIQTHLSSLALDVAPETAELSLGGVVAHRDPSTGAFRVLSGRVLVEAKAPGFDPYRGVIEAPPGVTVRERITLQPSPARAVPPAAPVSAAALVSSAPSAATKSAPRPPPAPAPEPPSRARAILIYSALGLGGAALVVGTVGAAKRASDLSTYDDDSQCDYGGVPRSQRCAGVASDFNRFTAVMIAGYATAAAAGLAATGFALFLPHGVQVGVSEPAGTGLLVLARGTF